MDRRSVVADDRSFDMLYDMVVELRGDVAAINKKLSERDGERRLAGWLMCTVSGLVGAVLGFIGQYVAYKT